MKKEFVITRIGLLVISESEATKNQCSKIGQREYQYKVSIKSHEHIDENGFVIDHNEINKAVSKVTEGLSCELMCHLITTDLQCRLVDLGVPFKSIKVRIRPLPIDDFQAFVTLKTNYI